MRFGPISEQDIARLTPLLEKAGVNFSIDRSLETLQEWRRAREERGPQVYPTFKGLVAGAFVDIADSDLNRLPETVADYGLIAPVERSIELDAFDDFICPQCDFAGHASSFCPRHLTPLVSFSQKTRAQQVVAETHRKVILYILIGVAILILLARGCHGGRLPFG